MVRTQRVSNGEVAAYGGQAHDPLAKDAHWRSRISGEGVGVRGKDMSGASTAVSMLWCPGAKQDHSGRSQRRPSELKVLQDLGRGPEYYQPPQPPPTPARPLRDVPSRDSRRDGGLSSRASQRSTTSVDTASLNDEGARLQAAAHERKLGQTYLRVGNLVEARKHLALAEKMLGVEMPAEMDAATASKLDEFKSSAKDTFA